MPENPKLFSGIIRADFKDVSQQSGQTKCNFFQKQFQRTKIGFSGITNKPGLLRNFLQGVVLDI